MEGKPSQLAANLEIRVQTNTIASIFWDRRLPKLRKLIKYSNCSIEPLD